MEDPASAVREREALDILNSDQNAADLLSENPFEVERVLIDSDTLHAVLTFDEAFTGDWPWEVCDEPFATGDITGAHFVVNVASEAIVASSPRWGEHSCLPEPDTEG